MPPGLAFKEFGKLTLETRKKYHNQYPENLPGKTKLFQKWPRKKPEWAGGKIKVIKNELGILKTPGVEDIVPEAFSDDFGMTLSKKSLHTE